MAPVDIDLLLWADAKDRIGIDDPGCLRQVLDKSGRYRINRGATGSRDVLDKSALYIKGAPQAIPR